MWSAGDLACLDMTAAQRGRRGAGSMPGHELKDQLVLDTIKPGKKRDRSASAKCSP